MKVNKNASTADKIIGLNTLVYGGTLVITNLDGSFAAGDSFQLFEASSYVGSFSAVNPPTPGPGLVWDLSRLNTGVLGVLNSAPLTPPAIAGFRIVPGGTMVISTTPDSGVAYHTGYLFASTNFTDWTCIRTSAFDGNGLFSITNAVDIVRVPMQFFRLHVQ